jgi:UDP-N-acetylmuramate: L-alanyl-gamma-D-glutamyl-meso-diaminopimelate ligase
MKQAGTSMEESSLFFTPPHGLRPELNRAPDRIHHVHLMGVCGTGMASLAGLLKERGLHVTGSDQNVYPPMSDFLAAMSIPAASGYRAENLAGPPDLVIVGNVITRDNPEALELARNGLPYLSLPQALRRYAIEGKRSIVVAGTHGKTTTSALASWVLETAGLAPGFMIGGIPRNFKANFKQGTGPYFVIEGDEYDSAFFDKGPKFLHYVPWTAVLTGIEFDHADIYRDLDHVLGSFRAFISLIPADGLLIVNADDRLAAAEAERANCPVAFYGLDSRAGWSAANVSFTGAAATLDVERPAGTPIPIETPLYGRHNMSNLIAVCALADHLGIDPSTVRRAAREFKGVRRRQEVRGEPGGVTVIDDFAHHPTAVRETIGAVREKYGKRRIVAVFEPRSNSSRRKIFQALYAESFDPADLVYIAEPPLMEKIPPEDRFSSRVLVEDLAGRGIEAVYSPDTHGLVENLTGRVRRGDVVLIMSNGAFDGLHEKLLARLDAAKAEAPSAPAGSP